MRAEYTPHYDNLKHSVNFLGAAATIDLMVAMPMFCTFNCAVSCMLPGNVSALDFRNPRTWPVRNCTPGGRQRTLCHVRDYCTPFCIWWKLGMVSLLLKELPRCFARRRIAHSFEALLPTVIQARAYGESLLDRHGRSHNYLRISLTEKCSLRCKLAPKI